MGSPEPRECAGAPAGGVICWGHLDQSVRTNNRNREAASAGTRIDRIGDGRKPRHRVGPSSSLLPNGAHRVYAATRHETELDAVAAPRPGVREDSLLYRRGPDAVMRDSGYSIVRAHRGHLDALPAIELAAAQLLKGHAPDSVLNETTDLRMFSDASDHGHLWVALFGDIAVGFALVRMLACDLPHLDELDVEPSHGRRGLGTALVQAVCEWSSASGYSTLTLTTFRAVPWNLPFYSRLGFDRGPSRQTSPGARGSGVCSNRPGLTPDTRAVMGYQCAPCDHQTFTPHPLSAAK